MRIRTLMAVSTAVAALAFGTAALAQPPHQRGMPGDMGGMQGMQGMHPGMGKEMGKGKGRGDDDGGRKRGARFKFERGDSEIDIRCPADESLQNCVEAATRLIDRVMGEQGQRRADAGPGWGGGQPR